MLEIKFDVTELNTEARQTLAAFILNWPVQIEHATLHNEARTSDDEINPFTPEVPGLPEGAAPSPIVEETSSLSSSADLDSEGLPWDSRIHSSSHGKLANGSWKLMRSVDPALVEQVKRELRGVMAAPAPKSHYLIDQPGAVVPPIPTPPSTIRHNFVEFIEDITQRLVSKKLTQVDILKACNDAGVASPNLLATRQDLIPQIAVALDLICTQS